MEEENNKEMVDVPMQGGRVKMPDNISIVVNQMRTMIELFENGTFEPTVLIDTASAVMAIPHREMHDYTVSIYDMWDRYEQELDALLEVYRDKGCTNLHIAPFISNTSLLYIGGRTKNNAGFLDFDEYSRDDSGATTVVSKMTNEDIRNDADMKEIYSGIIPLISTLGVLEMRFNEVRSGYAPPEPEEYMGTELYLEGFTLTPINWYATIFSAKDDLTGETFTIYGTNMKKTIKDAGVGIFPHGIDDPLTKKVIAMTGNIIDEIMRVGKEYADKLGEIPSIDVIGEPTDAGGEDEVQDGDTQEDKTIAEEAKEGKCDAEK